MAFNGHKIGVVVPCYKVTARIEYVLARMPAFVDVIYCIDDACPEGTQSFLKEKIKDNRVQVLMHKKNRGVGGAVVTGYKAAIADQCAVVAKIDGDGQMDPELLESFIAPILDGSSDYTKGNRFFKLETLKGMPPMRVFGNAVLSFFSKISSGYWHIFDPTNGYTAIHANVLTNIDLDGVHERYFFESDMLYQLGILRCVVEDIPMEAVYEEEESSLKISKIIWPFLKGHMKNFVRRIFYTYFLRNFNLASLQLLLGLPIFLFGLIFGFYHWSLSGATGIPATAGTVMIAAIALIVGIQMLLSFLNYDMMDTPRRPKWLSFNHAYKNKPENVSYEKTV